MASRRKTIAVDDPWYRLPVEQQGGEVKRLIESYKRSQGSRIAAYIRNLEAYEGRYLGGFSAHAFCETDGSAGYTRERLRLIRSAVSTAVASIYGPQKPKPAFQTLGATWDVRRRAQKLDKVCEGILNQRQGRWVNVWSMMIDAGTDAALQGVAAVMVYADLAQKRIGHKLVPLPDLYTDPAQGRNPVDLFMREPITVDEAIGRYNLRGKAADQVAQAPEYRWSGMKQGSARSASKVVELQYGWHLPSGPDSGDGCWATGVNGVTVEGDEFTAPAFPFVFLIWEPHRDGFWGSGIGDEGGAMSTECDDLDLRLHMREIIASHTATYYEAGSCKVDDLAVNDAHVVVAVDKGAQYPNTTVIPPFSPMELEYHQTKVRAFWDAIGISQVRAAARREQGVSSGVAMRTLNDTKAGSS